MRLMAIWGRKFWQQFGDERDIIAAMCEWTARIDRYTPDELHDKLEMAKGVIEWPDIGRILAIPLVPRTRQLEHRPFASDKAIGAAAIKSMLDSIGPAPADYPQRVNRSEEELAKEQRLLDLECTERTFGKITEETLARYRKMRDAALWSDHGILALGRALVSEES